METGTLLHEPSEPELAGWRVQRTLLGLVLLVVAVFGLYLAIKGVDAGNGAGDGAVLSTLVWLGASFAIGYFGLRYLLLGVLGGGVRIYERAVEADFHRGLGILPRRRTVPLLHVRVSGSSRLAYATAVTTTGHAFRLPGSLVERSDIWYLGSLGTSPIAPGGREAKERFEQGELAAYEHPASEPLPDHGPPYHEVGSTPITVEVELGTRPTPQAPSGPPPAAMPQAPPGTPTARSPPATAKATPMASPGPVNPRIPPASGRPVARPEMEVLVDLPDVVPPPDTGRRSIPPPPRYRPPSINVPEPPRHREMDRSDLDHQITGVGRPGPPMVEGVEEAPVPPQEPARPASPQQATVPPPEPSDGWELEEVPVPDGGKQDGTPPASSEWEEI